MFHISVASKSRLSHVTLMPTSEVFPSRFPFIHREYPGEAQTTRAPKSGDSRKFTPCRFQSMPAHFITHFWGWNSELRTKELPCFRLDSLCAQSFREAAKPPRALTHRATQNKRFNSCEHFCPLYFFLLPNFPLISSPLNPDSFQALSLHERNSSLVSVLESEWSRKILKQVVGM